MDCGWCLLPVFVVVLGVVANAQQPSDSSDWTIYITNDNCPDYTWGFTEEQTRQAFADVVRGHLDEMLRTDGEAPENRDRYNMAVTQEALCFIERYPEREAELVQRMEQGRAYVSPFLCNSLWAFHSIEGALRTLYPARRLERKWGIRLDVAEHIEEPSLPWGMASILAGCGVRWLSVPFYAYDSTFGQLKNPPLFVLEGPDGSCINVAMDPWACNANSYMQGARLLREPDRITDAWIPRYRALGAMYTLRAILASGTHGDINPHSGDQAREFAERIIAYNKQPGPHPKLVNATLPMFCEQADDAQAKAPFMPTIRGCFGHAWDVWPVSLAEYVADMREGERKFLAAEALLTLAAHWQPEIHEATRAERERAEWCWAMLSDHAWNGRGDENKRHNAELRRRWAAELNSLSQQLTGHAWAGLGLAKSDGEIAIFNSLSFPRSELVRITAPAGFKGVTAGQRKLDAQVVDEAGEQVLYVVAPAVPGFGIQQLAFTSTPSASTKGNKLRVSPAELESPFYRVIADPATGGIVSLLHKPTGTELVVGAGKRSLCQTVYHDGTEHGLSGVTSNVEAEGPVLARLRIVGSTAGIRVTTLVTVYAELDRVDFDVQISKPRTTKQERLCHVFPVLRDGAELRIETTGAVIRPFTQPQGDLLPGADIRRFAVQGFVDASMPNGPGVTIAPLDAFVLRMDLDPITFEALGNDQNYREVVQDQHGVTEFRFRYALRAHAGGYDQADAVAWSRSVATPLVAAFGKLGLRQTDLPVITVDPRRAIATCLKPADGDPTGGAILRLWEVGGQAGEVAIRLRGFRRAVLTDLLERDIKELPIQNGQVNVPLMAYGFAGLRLA